MIARIQCRGNSDPDPCRPGCRRCRNLQRVICVVYLQTRTSIHFKIGLSHLQKPGFSEKPGFFCFSPLIMNQVSIEAPKISLFTTFIDMIVAPAKAMVRVSTIQRRSWLLPALLCVLSLVLALWVSRDLLAAEALQQVKMQMSNMPPEQAEAAQPMLDRMMSPVTLFATGAITGVIGLALGWLISMVLLYFGASLLGADVKFSGLWPAVIWTWLPFAFRGFVQTAWTAVNDQLVHYSGLAYFFASGDVAADQRNMGFVAASQVDLFAVWHLLLVYVLLRNVTQLRTSSALILTLVYAVINLALRVLPVLLGTALSPG